MVECPDLHTPLNGAMSCVPISTGEYCTMSCNINFDIPIGAPITGEFVCDDAVGWVQSTNVPDCTSMFFVISYYILCRKTNVTYTDIC